MYLKVQMIYFFKVKQKKIGITYLMKCYGYFYRSADLRSDLLSSLNRGRRAEVISRVYVK